jgi:hypothetical protein
MNGLLTPLCVAGMFLLGPFLQVWVGSSLAVASLSLGRVLVVAIWFVGQSALARILIQAQGQPASSTRVAFVTLPLLAVALWIGIHLYGVLGAAVVVTLRSAIEYLVLSWIAKIRAQTLLLETAVHLGFLLVSVVLAEAFADRIGLPAALALGAVLTLASAVWSWLSSPSLRMLARLCLQRLAPSLVKWAGPAK